MRHYWTISSLISSLYVAPQLAHIHMIHSPHQSFHLASQPPQPGGKLPSHDVFLWDVFFWYCSRYFSAFEYYFPLIKHVFYLASSWTNPGQIAPSRYSPVCPTRQNLQTFSVSDESDSDIWNIEQMAGYSIDPPGLYVLRGFGKSEKVSHSLNMWTV